MHSVIDLAKTKHHENTHTTIYIKIKNIYYYFNGNIVGLAIHREGVRFPPLDFVVDTCLPQSSQPPGNV
jgi:hypothetical protein